MTTDNDCDQGCNGCDECTDYSEGGSMKIEPAHHQFQARDGKWCDFIDQRHYENTVADGSWPIRKLYTEAQIRQAMDACAAACDDVGKHPSLQPRHCAESIRELIKEMLP